MEQNDTYTSTIGLMELEICTKTFWNLSEKLRGKFPLSTLCLSMASISCPVNAFSEILELRRSLVEGQQLQQKDRKKRKEESEKKKKIKNERPKVVGWFIVQKSPNFDFCACLGKKVVKCNSSEMERRILRFKGSFDWFGVISADSRPQNVKKRLKKWAFLEKLQVSVG